MVATLLPYLGQKGTHDSAVRILDIVTAKGNAKEVFLKCNEGLKNILWERTYDDDDDNDNGGEATLADKLVELNLEQNGKADPVIQTVELYRATNKGTSFNI